MKIIVLVITVFFSLLVQAENSFIVKLKPNENPFVFGMQNSLVLKPIAKDIGLYSATHASGSTHRLTLSELNHSEALEYAQDNHPVTLRQATLSTDDHDFSLQWSLQPADFGIDAVSAWASYGTGGKDVVGHEIVVAVVDAGFDINHPDLYENRWVNAAEIPENNIDDDNNGYIDDINGWNVQKESGKLNVDEHGTHIAGIMGATGNNKEYISGVNWNVKIMYVSGGYQLSDTETVLRAYAYILKQKQLWISSGGAQGANVVAINSSFGINFADCNSYVYRAWNDMFNTLGGAGILSVAATANQAWDIDVLGDVPTRCNSEYLIAVTNSDKLGHRNSGAGYGATSIDLGAPGQHIYSTLPWNRSGFMDGTSMASPHVAGSVAYLYSAASAALINKSVAAPGEAALAIKKILLDTVTKSPSLNGTTVSGGILNLKSASLAAATY